MTTIPVNAPRGGHPGARAEWGPGSGVERAGAPLPPAALPRVTTLRRSPVNAGAVVFVTGAVVMAVIGAAWELVEAVVR